MTKIDAKKIFHGEIEFIKGAHNFSQIPQYHFPEIAFIGASNVGKSSLINAIFNKKIAIVSSTPGRTQQLNFFKNLGFRDGFMIVDLPGYGFAKAQDKKIQHWQDATFEYLLNSKNLKRIFLLIDSVKGLKNNDLEVIEIFNQYNIYFQIILTKIDKINLNDQQKIFLDIENRLKIYKFFLPNILKCSSSKKYGISEVQNEILVILKNL
jgi:GTP-binding protein